MTNSSAETRDTISPDAVLSAVADDHRRAVLQILNRTDGGVMEMSALTDAVAEHVRDGEPPDDDQRRRVRTALHHTHLPKLEACEMVVYDAETEQVRNVADELGQELLALIAPYETRR
ncbi:hypothetical protein M0R88_04450 [Halorussus gelatinilyticus]|uniref:DUF7344 domain-containing protein n=1 Tax=Halorussus gelatinilyticus TaxID=2937524 RepID=A0A8U0IKS4_9EURY|nr:hypothetical protein [Halorussus gelatinilyticus]UPW01358.1 hypothetical protein M0R88_04450 [Halorussus gelatinilyticus]